MNKEKIEYKCQNDIYEDGEVCEEENGACDYVLEGYADECCICGGYEEHQRCGSHFSELVDQAYSYYKDKQEGSM